MIKVTRLSKSFGNRKVLRELNFSAEPGEIISLIGQNGAGKTTLIRILSTLMRPDFGTIRFNGRDPLKSSSMARGEMGVVLHSPMVYGDLTGEENLAFFAKLYGLQKPEIRIDQVLALINLELRRKDLVRTYSRGMQQRLSIGRAILHDPHILLMDEPYTGLDQNSTARMDALLTQLANDGKVILLTSHDLERALAISTRIDILHGGQIADSIKNERLTAESLKDHFQTITDKSIKATRGQA